MIRYITAAAMASALLLSGCGSGGGGGGGSSDGAPSSSQAAFASSTMPGTWQISDEDQQSTIVIFEQDGSITEYSGSISGISDNDRWSVKSGKLKLTFSLYGTVLSEVTVAAQNINEVGCTVATATQSNSNWQRTWTMCPL